MVDRVGQQLGSYHLTHFLGRGSFAGVYLAEHIYLKTPAAVKVLYAHLDPEALDRFLVEARHLSQLSHPHIIHLRDFAIEGEIPFLVMDYASGGTLRQRHPTGTRVPPLTVSSYLHQIANGLQYAHDQKLIHRDLKPENLLIGSQQEILLGDFGIALVLNSAQYMNIAALSGTLTYIAPEQLGGTPMTFSDQYSLGILAYEWLSGERPFQGTLTELCAAHLLQSPPSLRKKVSDVPPVIEQVIYKALSKDPHSRFPTVRAFAEAFEQACLHQAPLFFKEIPKLPTEQGTRTSIDSQVEPPPIHFHNVPQIPSSFIGREEERKAAAALLMRPEVRLLTMVGVGGIGKTSLALSVASGLRQVFAHGICFVELASLIHPDQVIQTIASTLGLREQGSALLSESLNHFLHKKVMLLLLDNCEHLTEVGPVLTTLLSLCPQIKILVTSRAILHVSGEQIFPVPPLATPNLEQAEDLSSIASCTAITLFVERARVVRPEFDLHEENARVIAEICIHLDGLPLAIELAAARIRLLSPLSLLARLKERFQILISEKQDIPARQRTLLATINWSYSLLSEEEQRLFRRMAVFVDGCTVEAVEALYSQLGEDPTPVLLGISSLLDKSLVHQRGQQQGDPRVSLLETLREFGLFCLSEEGELLRCQQAHGAYYLSWMKQLMISGKMSAHVAPVPLLKPEYANIRSVLSAAISSGLAHIALFLANALTGYWFQRGTLSEGRQFLEQAIEACPHVEDDLGLRKALGFAYVMVSWIAYWQNDGVAARAALEKSLPLCQVPGKKRGYAASLIMLSMVQTQFPGTRISLEGSQGNRLSAENLLKESLTLFSAIGDQTTAAAILLLQGQQALYLDTPARARRYFQEGLAAHRMLSSPWCTAASLHFLGWICFLEKDPRAALTLSEEAIALFRTLGAPPYFAEALLIYAFEHLALDNEGEALTCLQQLLLLGRKMQQKEMSLLAHYGLGSLALHHRDLDHARTQFSLGLKLVDEKMDTMRLHWVIASTLEGLGMVVLKEKQVEWATRLFAAAESQRTRLSSRAVLGIEQPSFDRAIEAARNTLGEARFLQAWQEGRGLTPLEALQARKSITTTPISQTSSSEAIPRKAARMGLTKREMDVLRLLAEGQTNAQIAERLVLSVVTINSYLRSIYNKLGVSSRTQAMRAALDHGLLQ